MSNLRDYQNSLIARAIASYKSGTKRVLLQLSTGGGKTHIFIDFALNLVQRGRTVWITVHTDGLVTQTWKKLYDVTGGTIPIGIIKSGVRADYSAPIQIVSIQSWRSRRNKLAAPNLIICDEAHRSIGAVWQEYLNAYPEAGKLGVTATPIRLDGRGLREQWDVLHCGPQTKWLIEEGYLAPFEYGTYRPLLELIASGRREVNRTAIGRKFDPLDYGPALVEEWLRNEARPSLLFAITREHGRLLVDQFVEAGIGSTWLDYESTQADRDTAISAVAANWRSLPLIGNMQLFTEGIDMPVLERVLLCRPTMSVGLTLQMWGRALRIAPGKDKAVFWDFVELWREHGFPDDDRHWSLDGLKEPPETVVIDAKPAGATVPTCQEFEVMPDGAELKMALRAMPTDEQWWNEWLVAHAVKLKSGYWKPAAILLKLKDHTKDAPVAVWQAAEALAIKYSKMRFDVKEIKPGFWKLLYDARKRGNRKPAHWKKPNQKPDVPVTNFRDSFEEWKNERHSRR